MSWKAKKSRNPKKSSNIYRTWITSSTRYRILSQVRGIWKGSMVLDEKRHRRKLRPPARTAVKLLQPTWHCNPHRVAGRSSNDPEWLRKMTDFPELPKKPFVCQGCPIYSDWPTRVVEILLEMDDVNRHKYTWIRDLRRTKVSRVHRSVVIRCVPLHGLILRNKYVDVHIMMYTYTCHDYIYIYHICMYTSRTET